MCVMGVDTYDHYLAAVSCSDSNFYIIDTQTHLEHTRIRMSGCGYAALTSLKYPYVFISEWDGPFVDVFDIDSQKIVKKIPVGTIRVPWSKIRFIIGCLLHARVRISCRLWIFLHYIVPFVYQFHRLKA